MEEQKKIRLKVPYIDFVYNPDRVAEMCIDMEMNDKFELSEDEPTKKSNDSSYDDTNTFRREQEQELDDKSFMSRDY